MDSASEVDFAGTMDVHGIRWLYAPDNFPWYPPVKSYTPDFKVYRKDGSSFYVEYKGFLWNEDKTKMKAMKEQHPNVDIRFVFANAKKPVHGAKTRKNGTKMSHAEWAEKHDYKWAEGFIPPAWLEEKGDSEC